MGQSLESPNAGLPAVLSHGVMVSINTSWQPCVIYTWSSDNQGSPSQSWYPEVDLIPRDPMPPPYSPEWLSSHQGNRHSCRTFPGLRDHLPGAKNKGQNKGIALLKKKKYLFIQLCCIYLLCSIYYVVFIYLAIFIYLAAAHGSFIAACRIFRCGTRASLSSFGPWIPGCTDLQFAAPGLSCPVARGILVP